MRRVPRLGAFFPLWRCFASPTRTTRLPLPPLPQRVGNPAYLKNAPSRGTRRTGTSSPTQSTRLGSLTTLGRGAFGGSPCPKHCRPWGRRMFRRLRKDDGYAVFSLPHPHVRAAPVNAASENHFFIVEGGICVRKNRFRSQMPCASARRFPWGKLAGSRKRAKGGRY